MRDAGFNYTKTGRTLLQTCSYRRNIVSKSHCKYYYFNLATVISEHLSKNAGDNCDNIPLSLNIDGLPLFKSSINGVWPILLNIMDSIYHIAITYGRKPKK